MVSGARRCTPIEAYELAWAIRMERVERMSKRDDPDPSYFKRSFSSLDELIDYLANEKDEEDAPRRRWWEFWK